MVPGSCGYKLPGSLPLPNLEINTFSRPGTKLFMFFQSHGGQFSASGAEVSRPVSPMKKAQLDHDEVPWSRINATHPGVVSDPVDCQHVGRGARIDGMRISIPAKIIEACDHRILKPLVDDAFTPEITHSILHPFEI